MKNYRESVINSMFKPKSIAVVGASARDGSLGNTVMKKIIGFGFKGKVFPINPKTPQILGLKVYKNIRDVPQDIDTAVICVPGQAVLGVVKDIHEKNIKSCIIISAGFKEIGDEGIERENELKDFIKKSGIRVVGPNCFGIINGLVDVSLDCTFARNFAPKGNIGFISQSGAVGAAINEDLRKTTMGLSYFISLGNRIDVNENEVLEYLAEDHDTKVIFLYLENFADPVKFLEVAQKITPIKPIIVLKAGKSKKGSIAAASHTGQLAQSEKMVEALLEKAGVIRVDTVPQMINAAKVLYSGVIPENEELAVITNAGGFGVLAIDKAEELDIKLADFSKETVEFLESRLPEEASCHNPVDVLGTGTDLDYGIALEGVLKDPKVGGVVYNFGPPVMQKAEPIAQKAVDIAKKYPHKPILSIYMNRNRILEPLKNNNSVYVSQFDYPEDAVWAYKKLLQYRQIKKNKNQDYFEYNGNKEIVKGILNKAKEEGRNFLNFDEGQEVLDAYKIPRAKAVVIRKEDSVDKKTSSLSYPVALKPLWGGISHKTEINAVKIGLKTPGEVLTALRDMEKRISVHMGQKYDKGFIVQEMTRGVQETIIGAVKQDIGLYLIMFGLGGIFVELLKDVSFSIPPFSSSEVIKMIKRIKGYPLLEGFRGRKKAALCDIEEAILKLSCLIVDFPQIKELDINPFIVSDEPRGSKAVDIRIIL